MKGEPEGRTRTANLKSETERRNRTAKPNGEPERRTRTANPNGETERRNRTAKQDGEVKGPNHNVVVACLSLTEKRVEHLDYSHRPISQPEEDGARNAFGRVVRSEVRYRLLGLATRPPILVVSRVPVSAAEPFSNIGAHGISGPSELCNVEQALPPPARPGIDYSIHLVRDEISGFLNRNSTSLSHAG